MTPMQKIFCDEYLKDFNATRAATAAGYSENVAGQQGYENLKKPEIVKYINSRLAQAQLTADESLKMLSDITKGNLSNYFVSRQVEKIPRVKVGLQKLIADAQKQIEFEKACVAEILDKFLPFSDADREAHIALLKELEIIIVRYNVELKQNPQATRIVDGPVEFIEVAELDLKKLIADKQYGKIKSITPTQFGIKVELCAPDAALTNVLRTHGAFEKDNEQRNPINNFDIKIGYKKEAAADKE